MPAYDLIIRDGTIVDGTGRAPFVGDVGIVDGLIAAVGRVDGRGREEIDAMGRLVTPGFIDIHTHYDGQVTWEHRVTPSSEHGVTTVVMGNCGVGFAPCKPAERALLVKVMEGVEDIPEIVMTTGVPWSWQSFPEYLDFLATRKYDADCAAYIPHAAVRVFVMGERGANREPATAEDRRRMSELVTEAVNAGALGVSTSRSLAHRDSEGKQAPHVRSADEELVALAQGLRDAGTGVLQIAAGLTGQQLKSVIPEAGQVTPDAAVRREIELYQHLCRLSGRPLMFSLTEVHEAPEMVQQALDLLAAANAEAGVHIKAQIYPRPIGLLFGLDLSLNPFSLHPSYKAIAHLPLQERVKRMRDPVLRAQILSEQSDATHPNPMQKFLVARSLDAYPFTQNVDYEPDPATSLRSIAARDGKDVCAVAYDTLLEQNGGAILFLPINNFAAGTLDSTYDMLVNDHTLIGLGDGGAHYGFICDASFPTFVLRHWTRERTRGDGRHLSIAEAVHRLSMRNAMAVGLKDRGVIATGMKADLNVIDYDRLQLASPQAAFDLPAGGRRLTQKAQGIDATIVNGVVTYRKGVPTGELPGRLVRGRGV